MRIDLFPQDDIAAVIRASSSESVVVVIHPGRDPVAQAQALAALSPLAIERAPGLRLNAVVVGDSATRASIAAAAVFLDAAASMTGQVIVVS